MPQETPTSNVETKSKNTLIILLLVFIVGLVGILIGLITFVFTSKLISNTITSAKSSIPSLTATSLTASSSITTNSPSALTTNSTTSSNSSMSISTTSSTNSSSSISFSHNEGKYIRFDYPTGWKVDVQGTTGTINSFDDIGSVRIENGGGYSLWLNLMGGLGCTSPSSMIDSLNTTQAYNYNNPDDMSLATDKKFQIDNFSAIKLNVPSSKNIYLTSFSFVNEIPPYKTKSITQLMSLDNGIYNEYNCGFTTLDKLNFNSDYKIFSVGVPENKTISQYDLTTIIERFTNSFQKK